MRANEITENWRQFTPQDKKNQFAQLKKTLTQAYTSSLYRKLWNHTDFKPDAIQNLKDISLIPFLNRQELFNATRTKRNKICVKPLSHWFLCDDLTNGHKWFPLSEEDFTGIAPMLDRMSQIAGLQKGEIVLAVVDTPPNISAFVPYLWSNSPFDKGLEFIIGSLDWYDTLGMSWINFIQKRRPTVILSSAKNAQALADKIQTMNTAVKNVLPELRVGIFYGNNGEMDLAKVLKPFEVEAFEVYSPTEHMAFCSECNSHSGIHLWLDTCIPEIIPSGHKEALLIGDAESGTKGELVITNFSKALPLIRYKTEKYVQVESIDQCVCGCNHPKVKFIKKTIE
jgi:phenylacetate-coenzyme A ligase PaaK-like adenylate-forming protein